MTTRKTKQTKALDAGNGHQRHPQPEAISISYHGHGIAELAQHLADLEGLSIEMGDARGDAARAIEKYRDAGEAGSDAHTAACCARQHFENVDRRARAMADALQQTILGMEPATLDETLSLSLAFASHLDVFLCNHIESTDHVIATAKSNMEDTLRAVIRGLVAAGAESPLLPIYSHEDWLLPWAESRSTAVREAGPFKLTYDPVGGKLTGVAS